MNLLDRIDDVTAPVCAQCAGELGDSPSDDFCSPWCQQAWTEHEAGVRELIGYVDPWDRPWDFPGVGGESARWRDGETAGDPRLPGFTTDWAALREAFEWMERLWARQAQQCVLAWERLAIHGLPMSGMWFHEDDTSFYRRRTAEPEISDRAATDRLDLSWLDHYVAALDEPVDQEKAARRLFPGKPVEEPADLTRAGPQVHADPRRNR